ncbi:MAG: UbiA family prenyltransferase [Flavobacteriales bacterium]
MRKFLLLPLLNSNCDGLELQMGDIDFILSILVVILLTASGNIINDYFDVKVDKINKPDRVIIGKQVKRRVAMMLHQVLNFGSIAISGYLCFKYGIWWPIAIPILVATLLWWYSPVFKKMNFLGNLVVAVCVSIIPIWAGAFEITETATHYADSISNISALKTKMWFWTGMYSAFAFLLTLIKRSTKRFGRFERR